MWWCQSLDSSLFIWSATWVKIWDQFACETLSQLYTLRYHVQQYQELMNYLVTCPGPFWKRSGHEGSELPIVSCPDLFRKGFGHETRNCHGETEKLVYPSLVELHFQDFNLLVFVHNTKLHLLTSLRWDYTATSKLIIKTQARVWAWLASFNMTTGSWGVLPQLQVTVPWGLWCHSIT